MAGLKHVRSYWFSVHFWAVAACAAAAFCFGAMIARAEVVVGVAAPSDGVKASIGQEIVAAARARVAALNASGGFGGKMLRLVVVDDACAEAGGQTAATSLVEQRAALVLGHPCSSSAIAAARIYAGAGVWFGATGAGHPALTTKRGGPTIFRLTGSDDHQARDTAAAVVRFARGRRIGVIHDRTAYARRLAEGVVAGLKASGVTVTLIDGLVAGEKQYIALAAKVAAARIETVYFAGFAAERRILARDLAGAGAKVQIVANDASAEGGVALLDAEPAVGQSFFMVRRAGEEAVATASALEALVRSGGKLDAFAGALGVEPGGDRIGPSYWPALER